MDYSIYLYIFFTFLSIYTLSGINFEKIMLKNKPIQARCLVMILSMISGYLLTQFILAFLNVSQIY